MNRRVLLGIGFAFSLSCVKPESRPISGSGGSGGQAGIGGQAGSGVAGGQAGASGPAGSSGSTGQAGGGGNPGTAGNGGAAGTTGAAGVNGAAGTGAAGTKGAAGTTGTAGTTGAAGTTGTGGTTGAAGSGATSACGKLLPQQTSESVLQRGKNSQRTAHFIHPSLTLSAVDTRFGPDTAFNNAARFTGNLEGVPLFVAGSTPGKGMYIVASHGNGNSILTAIDETTGATVWSHVLGASNNGVRSTPVIDGNGIVYTAFDANTGGSHFEVHASSIANQGAEVAGWPVNVSNVTSGNGSKLSDFDMGKEIQRGALSLVNGILYIPFGGVFGDAPSYKGIVVAVNTANPSQVGAWAVAGDRSGLWQGGGLASDGASMFAATANGGDGTHQDSEEVVRITGMGTATHNSQDVFFPSNWKNWDGQDNDVGSSSPLVLQFSNTSCRSMVVAPSKPGHLFFLDPANLGGANGNTPLRELVLATNANPGGEYKVLYAAPTAYISASGVHVAMETRLDAACPGGGGGDQLMSVSIDMTTNPPTPKVAWCQPVQGGEDRHSPISTTTDGVNNAIVWFVFNAALNAYDGDKGGAPLFTSGACGNVQKQTSPISADGHIVVGADSKLCSYSVQP